MYTSTSKHFVMQFLLFTIAIIMELCPTCITEINQFPGFTYCSQYLRIKKRLYYHYKTFQAKEFRKREIAIKKNKGFFIIITIENNKIEF